jgi:outer membrane protein TolC
MATMLMDNQNIKILIIVLLGIFIAAGCAIKPIPLKPKQVENRVDHDLSKLYKKQIAITEPLNLWDIIARALKYNLAHRVKVMEIALKERSLEVSNYKMLPDLVLAAGYQERSNDSGGIYQSLITGQQSLEASTTEPRDHSVISFNVVLNVLDFGISYAVAQQLGNEVLIAKERRRRMVQTMIKEIQSYYWQTVAAQRLLPSLEILLNDIQLLLAGSKEQIQESEKILSYRKRLLETYQELFMLQGELSQANTQLAMLMNLPPGTAYDVEIPENYEIPTLKVSLEDLESQALLNQPLLREADYLKRINQLEIKKSILRLFPGLEVSWGGYYSSNQFLSNQKWRQAGLQISWNLLNVFTGGLAQKKATEAQLALGDHQRMALSMAVLTELWFSYHKYKIALEDFKLVQDLYGVEDQLQKLENNEFEMIFVRANKLKSQINRELAYAKVHTALAQVRFVAGLDPMPGTLMMRAVK